MDMNDMKRITRESMRIHFGYGAFYSCMLFLMTGILWGVGIGTGNMWVGWVAVSFGLVSTFLLKHLENWSWQYGTKAE